MELYWKNACNFDHITIFVFYGFLAFFGLSLFLPFYQKNTFSSDHKINF